MNEVWQEESKLVPSDGESYSHFGYDVALSGDTAIISSPYDGEIGTVGGSVYVLIRRGDGAWEEVQKLTPTDGEIGDFFGSSVAISGNTAVIGAMYEDKRDSNSGSVYVYTKIGGKWIKNVKIVPENGAADDYFGTSVAIFGSTALFVAPNTGEDNAGEENGGTAYIVDDIFVPC